MRAMVVILTALFTLLCEAVAQENPDANKGQPQTRIEELSLKAGHLLKMETHPLKVKGLQGAGLQAESVSFSLVRAEQLDTGDAYVGLEIRLSSFTGGSLLLLT